MNLSSDDNHNKAVAQFYQLNVQCFAVILVGVCWAEVSQQAHDVRMTSGRRRCDVASTLIGRHSDVMCSLG